MKAVLIGIGVLLYLAAVILYPVPVLGSTLVGLVIWFLIYNDRERRREQEEKERDRESANNQTSTGGQT